MEKEVFRLYKDYKNGQIGRRLFLKQLAIITGSTGAALTLLPVLEANELKASNPSGQEEDLITESITYPAQTGEMKAFLASPGKGKKFPAVIVIHENRGLVPHIRDVTRRMAKEGFLSLAPDALSPLGGTPEDISNVREMFKQLDREKTVKNFVAAVKYLKTHSLSTGKVGCTGFCWGGAMTNQVAVNSPDLDAMRPRERRHRRVIVLGERVLDGEPMG